ncbi:MAG: aldehyde ferredoxin oxidoreductase, partial [Chloroflexota bacterium]
MPPAAASLRQALRKAGFDRLIILGKAARPSYLLVQDGSISICEAEGLWGTTVPQAQKMLRAAHGLGTVSAVIGPAGENRVRMAA